MKNFSERLKWVVKNHLKTTKMALAQRLATAPSYIGELESGKKTNPSDEFLRTLSQVSGVSLEWLKDGNGEPLANDVVPTSNATFAAIPTLQRGQRTVVNGVTWQAVPVISWASAGAALDYCDVEWQFDQFDMAPTKDPHAIILEIEGDSMEPRFYAGDHVVVEPSQPPRKNKYVVARLHDGGVLFKLCSATGEDGRNVVLQSLNPTYQPIERPREDFRFIYPVTHSISRLR